MTLLSPSLSLPTRQIIVKGRAFVRLTETPLDVVMAALSFTTATNAGKIATWLENDPRIDYVTYAGLDSSPYSKLVPKICPKGAGALFTIAVKGGYDACIKLVDSLEIFSHVANLGDARSLIIHSASTTHRQLSPEQQEAAGAGPNIVRLSIGIENVEDLIADLDQALTKATA